MKEQLCPKLMNQQLNGIQAIQDQEQNLHQSDEGIMCLKIQKLCRINLKDVSIHQRRIVCDSQENNVLHVQD